MTVTAPEIERLASAASLIVAVRLQGATLPRQGDQPEVPIGLDDLELLRALVTDGQVPAGIDHDARGPLLDALRARGLLVSAEPARVPVTSVLEPSPAGPAADEGSVDGILVLPTPTILRCRPEGFEFVDHDGRVRARLTSVELIAAASLGVPATVAHAHDEHRSRLDHAALDADAFTALVRRLIAAGLVVPFDPDDEVHARRTRQAEAMAEGMRRQMRVHQEFDRLEAEHDAAPGATHRVPVVGFHTSWSGVPASLGMIIASAKAHEGGILEEAYDFRPRLLWDRARLEAFVPGRGGIYLFSNYIWSTAVNLLHSALVKSLDPHSVTIHGGPDTPKYPADAERFFAANPHVDIAVHGEGEETFAHLLAALRGHVGDGPPDLTVLADVPGLSFRDGDGVVAAGARDRVADLDTIPSPILTGLFDGFIPGGRSGAVVLETNRGCPYGCTFCDWGSATLSRVRKFDIDRIFAELEWCATHGFETVGIADANFGIFERDVEIAEKIAALKASYGVPRFVGNNYAKNTVKHLSKIIEMFTEAGIVAEGKMSMQTFDAETLVAVHRKNIKVEKYHDLAGEFRRNELPMMVDIMMGLPGATPATFRSDLQECIDRAVRVAIHSTLLLPNSPMNDPEYRAEHRITALPGEEVRETASYTREDWEHMNHLTWGYYVLENFGVLRQVATYVRAETGQREIDFYAQLVDDVHVDPYAWPLISIVLKVLPELMVPPVSWQLFLDEVHRYLIDRVGLADDEVLATVLAVQKALLPARDRSFPLTLELDHDYVLWHNTIADLRDQGRLHDWHLVAPRLGELGPASFSVDDPFDVCSSALGGSIRSLMVENAWDLESPVSRPRQRITDDALLAS